MTPAHHRFALTALLTGIICAGCTSNEFIGTVGGHGLAAKSAVIVGYTASVRQVDTGEIYNDSPVAALVMSDSNTLCKDMESGHLKRDHAYFGATLARASVDNLRIAPTNGSYGAQTPGSFTNQGVSTGYFEYIGLNCGADFDGSSRFASSGSMRIDTIDLGKDGSASGTFDLKFPDGSHAQGSFDAVTCPAMRAIPQTYGYVGLWPCE